MPATTARITKRTPVVPTIATSVKPGDTLTTNSGDVLTVEKVYVRNGQVVMHFDGNKATIPAGASVNRYDN